MITFIQFKNGVTSYLDKEMMAKIQNPLLKYTAVSALYVVDKKATNIFNTLKDNSIVKTLELIDSNGNIDEDLLLEALKSGMKNQTLSFNTGLLGTITLYPEDIDKLKAYMKPEKVQEQTVIL